MAPVQCIKPPPPPGVRSKVVVLLLLIYCLMYRPLLVGVMYLPLFVEVMCWSLFWYVILYVLSRFAVILTKKRELVALLLLSFVCLVTVNVLWLFLTVPSVGLQCVVMVSYSLLERSATIFFLKKTCAKRHKRNFTNFFFFIG